MKKIILILSAIALSGCMADSLEKQAPIYQGHSAKNVDQLNRCITPKWQDLKPSTNSAPTENGYRVLSSEDIFGALAIARIEPSINGGADVKVYAVARGFNDHWASAVRSCM